MNKSNISLVLSLLAFIGMLLFWIIGPTSKHKDFKEGISDSSSGHRIAYIHTDSILAHYDFVKVKADELAEKAKKFDADITRRQQELEKEAAYFQESVKKNALSEKSAQEIYGQLMQKQQGIMELKDRYQQELALDEANINVILIDTVTGMLKRFNKDLHFDYILGYNKTGNIFYTNSALDITKDVLEILNKEYNSATKRSSKKLKEGK